MARSVFVSVFVVSTPGGFWRHAQAWPCGATSPDGEHEAISLALRQVFLC
jgi:hypothetical protein